MGQPFVLRPPYAPADLASRVNLVTPSRLHCCGPDQWNAFTRQQLKAWAESGAPVVAIHVAAETGAVSRTTDADRPELRTLAEILARTDAAHALNRAIVNLTEHVARQF